MTDRPDDSTQPISTESTSEQPAVDAGVPTADTAQPATDAVQPAGADVPRWANAASAGDGTASARPVPVADPAASYGPSVPPIAATATKAPWRSKVSSGRGLAVAALVVGLGVGAVGGAAVTFAATSADRLGTTADGSPRFDHDGDGSFGPHGGRGGPPPGGQLPGGQLPGGQLPGGDDPQQDDSTPGQLPGGGTGSTSNGGAPAI